ncbi:unnamed protein product [Urochloa humidicola]
MALSDYAVFLPWAAAALVVYAAAAVANRRGWGSVDHRPQATVVLLTGLLAQRASAPKLGECRVPQAGVVEAGPAVERAPGGGPYVLPLVFAICVLCVILVAFVAVAVRVARMVPPP